MRHSLARDKPFLHRFLAHLSLCVAWVARQCGALEGTLPAMWAVVRQHGTLRLIGNSEIVRKVARDTRRDRRGIYCMVGIQRQGALTVRCPW